MKARDIFLWESRESSYRFVIRPPWFRTPLAYLLFALTGLLAVIGVIKLYTLRLQREKDRLEMTVADRTVALSEANTLLAAKAQELEASNRMLERVNSIVRVINAEHDLDSLLRAMLREVMTLKGVEKASVLSFDKVLDSFRFVASIGWEMSELDPIRMTQEEAEARYCSRAEEIFPDIFVVTDLAGRDGQELGARLAVPAAMLVIRIRFEERIWGYLVFDNMSDRNAFSRADVEILSRLKDHIVSAFIKDRLLSDLEFERQVAELANHAKSLFLARMSHEIRTPMNGVLGFAELMLDTELTEEQQEYMRTINHSGEALLSLLNDILDITKIESGMFTMEEIDFDLEVTAFDVCELIQPRIGTKPVEIVCQVDDAVPNYVVADPGRTRQVIMNLMGNAVKFTASGEIRLTLTIDRERDEELLVHCRVEDTGIGIPPESLEKIFEVFRQADETTTRKFGGTGLGLSISRQIARLMKGDVWAESEPGRGSTFHFTAWMGKSLRRPEPPVLEVNLEGKRVLAVDDNVHNLEIVSHTLGKLGMRTVTLLSGFDVVSTLAREQAAGDPFDVCIVDIQMPGMSGYAVAQEIRQSGAPFAVLPLLAFSGSISRQTQLVQKMGFDGFLPKPLRRERLASMLQGLLGKKKGDPGAGGRILTRHTMVEAAKHSVSILVAEDNPINQKLIQFSLGNAGYSLEVVGNGREVIERITAEPSRFQLIFMDVQMPEMDGLEATRRLRAAGFTDIPIIAMTAGAWEGDRQRCLEAGMNDYIAKPLKRGDVFAKIKEWTLGR